MDCLHPLSIKNPDFGKSYDTFEREFISVPCGHCCVCIVNNAQEWRTRLEIEWQNSSSAYFVTLTYDDARLPIGNFTDCFGNSYVVPYVCKRDIQLFLKRLRKRFKENRIRYFIVSEYGPITHRPHYHGIFFGLPRLFDDRIKNECEINKEIARLWNNGMTKLDSVTYGRVAYVTKYMSCVTDLPEYLPKPFRLMSRRPAIGSSYLLNRDLIDWHRITLSNYYPDGRFRRRLPRYLKDKIFDDAMKIEIKEQIKFNQNEKVPLGIRARNLGYDRISDYIEVRNERYQRKFEQRMKKNRKDL